MTDEEYRALIEQAHQLTELTKHPGWSVLSDLMNVEMNPAKRRTLNGNIVTYDEYLKTTFEFVGIHRVLDAPTALAEVVGREHGRRTEEEE